MGFEKQMRKAWEHGVSKPFGKALAIEQTGARRAGNKFLDLGGKALFTPNELLRARKRSVIKRGR